MYRRMVLKAKFATYMEVDLQGMTTTELLVLKKAFDVMQSGEYGHHRPYFIAKYIGYDFKRL